MGCIGFCLWGNEGEKKETRYSPVLKDWLLLVVILKRKSTEVFYYNALLNMHMYTSFHLELSEYFIQVLICVPVGARKRDKLERASNWIT